jgi:hypothetical protein
MVEMVSSVDHQLDQALTDPQISLGLVFERFEKILSREWACGEGELSQDEGAPINSDEESLLQGQLKAKTADDWDMLKADSSTIPQTAIHQPASMLRSRRLVGKPSFKPSHHLAIPTTTPT